MSVAKSSAALAGFTAALCGVHWLAVHGCTYTAWICGVAVVGAAATMFVNLIKYGDVRGDSR